MIVYKHVNIVYFRPCQRRRKRNNFVPLVGIKQNCPALPVAVIAERFKFKVPTTDGYINFRGGVF